MLLFKKLSTVEPENWTQSIYLKRPQILDIMEYDEGQLQQPKNLSYFKNPRASLYPLDLNEGFENYQFRNESLNSNSLSKIEAYLKKHGLRELDLGAEAEEMCKIYTVRSVLYRLMEIPYRIKSASFNLNFYVSKFNDIIYVSRGGDCKYNRNLKSDSYHFKFRQYCFSDSPTTEPKTDIPIDENKQTYCIFNSQVKNFNITYSAEITGVSSEREIKDLTNMNELNECGFVLTKLHTNCSWRKSPKCFKWWLQAYLSNSSEIYLGIKDTTGKVCVPVMQVAVKDIPKDQKWKPHVCVGFLHDFLSMVKNKMSQVNCPHTVYEFKYDSTKRCISYRIHEGRTDYSFLTHQFVDHMQKKHS